VRGVIGELELAGFLENNPECAGREGKSLLGELVISRGEDYIIPSVIDTGVQYLGRRAVLPRFHLHLEYLDGVRIRRNDYEF
jgi:hypothetical protein